MSGSTGSERRKRDKGRRKSSEDRRKSSEDRRNADRVADDPSPRRDPEQPGRREQDGASTPASAASFDPPAPSPSTPQLHHVGLGSRIDPAFMAGTIEADLAFVEQAQIEVHPLAIFTHENQRVPLQRPVATLSANG